MNSSVFQGGEKTNKNKQGLQPKLESINREENQVRVKTPSSICFS